MFKLMVEVDGIKSKYQSDSQMRMVREAIDRLHLKGSRTKIPFSGLINENGQIIQISIDTNIDPEWWDKEYPFNGAKGARMKVVLSKIDIEDAEQGYAIDSGVFIKSGPCWAAIKDMKVIAIEYVSGRDLESFHTSKFKYLDILNPLGTPVFGEVTSKKFYPKEIC